MLLIAITGVLAFAGTVQDFDTTFVVERGTRLEARNFAGEIVVHTWDRDEVRITAKLSRRQRVDVKRRGSVIRIRSQARRGPINGVDYEIQVPVWMPLDLSGTYSDVDVRGAGGEVNVEVVHGDVTVAGGSGYVSIATTQGNVAVEHASGRIYAKSTNGELELTDVSGDITTETINGDITLRDVRGKNAEAVTVNGDIEYRGSIEDDGRYLFSTHNGDVTVAMTRNTNATVTVATSTGEFESEFPVTINRTGRGKRITFTLGTGSARVELESFGGTIRIGRFRR